MANSSAYAPRQLSEGEGEGKAGKQDKALTDWEPYQLRPGASKVLRTFYEPPSHGSPP